MPWMREKGIISRDITILICEATSLKIAFKMHRVTSFGVKWAWWSAHPKDLRRFSLPVMPEVHFSKTHTSGRSWTTLWKFLHFYSSQAFRRINRSTAETGSPWSFKHQPDGRDIMAHVVLPLRNREPEGRKACLSIVSTMPLIFLCSGDKHWDTWRAKLLYLKFP